MKYALGLFTVPIYKGGGNYATAWMDSWVTQQILNDFRKKILDK